MTGDSHFHSCPWGLLGDLLLPLLPFFFQESRFLIGLHYRRILKSFLRKEVRLYISELSFEESSLVILGGIISPLLQINKTVKGA